MGLLVPYTLCALYWSVLDFYVSLKVRNNKRKKRLNFLQLAFFYCLCLPFQCGGGDKFFCSVLFNIFLVKMSFSCKKVYVKAPVEVLVDDIHNGDT